MADDPPDSSGDPPATVSLGPLSWREEARIGCFVLLALPLLLVTLPVTLPLAAWSIRRDERRRRAAARISGCACCGTVLGAAALARADAAWAAHFAALGRDHPGTRFRLVRNLHAICGTCGARHLWDETGRGFVLVREEG